MPPKVWGQKACMMAEILYRSMLVVVDEEEEAKDDEMQL
jgi:hypothetical protein